MIPDDLHLRAGLPAEFRYLEPACARADWPALRLHPTAAHWLEVHDWFRGMLEGLVDLGADWREGRIDASAYRTRAIPRLRHLLSHLDGHHHYESRAYFPAMAALEPGMAKGFDLLDRDHEAIERLMSAMAEAATGLSRAAADAHDPAPHVAALAREIDHGGALIGRHLLDEEEIIVPVLTLRGDPLHDH